MGSSPCQSSSRALSAVSPTPPSRTSGPSPPPENRTSAGTAVGATVPSFLRTSVVSRSVHSPSLRTRWGTVDCSMVNEPPGLANTCVVDVVRPLTSTRESCRAAARDAAASVAAASTGSAVAARAVAPTDWLNGDPSTANTRRVTPSDLNRRPLWDVRTRLPPTCCSASPAAGGSGQTSTKHRGEQECEQCSLCARGIGTFGRAKASDRPLYRRSISRSHRFVIM
ncbi:hypothetical protein J2S53_001117 [Actinopolyspora lacussalsi]|nr:hypothetical protein [Actinopolyspora lacussalsi]